jgi:hypothetical protein
VKLIGDGGGVISNGHWLLRMPVELLEKMPEGLETKAGIFRLQEPCAIGEGPGRPDDLKQLVDKYLDARKRKRRADLERQNSHPVVLLHQISKGEEQWSVVTDDPGGRYYFDRDYLKGLLALGGHDDADPFPAERWRAWVGPKRHGYDSLVIEICEGVDTVLMPKWL